MKNPQEGKTGRPGKVQTNMGAQAPNVYRRRCEGVAQHTSNRRATRANQNRAGSRGVSVCNQTTKNASQVERSQRNVPGNGVGANA